jgi:hypothetical protein
MVGAFDDRATTFTLMCCSSGWRLLGQVATATGIFAGRRGVEDLVRLGEAACARTDHRRRRHNVSEPRSRSAGLRRSAASPGRCCGAPHAWDSVYLHNGSLRPYPAAEAARGVNMTSRNGIDIGRAQRRYEPDVVATAQVTASAVLISASC